MHFIRNTHAQNATQAYFVMLQQKNVAVKLKIDTHDS